MFVVKEDVAWDEATFYEDDWVQTEEFFGIGCEEFLKQGEFWEQLVFLWHTLSHKGLFLYARNVLWKIKKNIFQIPEHIFRLFEYENNVSSLKARVVLISDQWLNPLYRDYTVKYP